MKLEDEATSASAMIKNLNGLAAAGELESIYPSLLKELEKE